jgi:cytochrome c-type biogenesis protein CcmH/NrfG
VPARVPDSPELSDYKARLEKNPNDHDSRLRLARALRDKGNWADSVAQYETLVENLALLDAVSSDLAASTHPRARRLLGDIYMRQGRLQEALDTYRGALNQL